MLDVIQQRDNLERSGTMLEMKNLALGALLILTTVLAGPASAHSIKIGEDTVDYGGLTGGENGMIPCCNDKDCQPAVEWEWVEQKKQWRFRVRRFHDKPDSELVDVYVDEKIVSHENLTKKKSAHWCGYFDTDVNNKVAGWHTYCAFVPPPETM